VLKKYLKGFVRGGIYKFINQIKNNSICLNINYFYTRYKLLIKGFIYGR